MTVRAVVFDLDDTLFDHTGSATAGLRDWLTELGHAPTDDLVSQWFRIEQVHFDSWLAGKTTHQGQRRARLREYLPLLGRTAPPDDDAADAAYEVYLKWYRRSWRAYDDARPALEVAQGNGLRIGVLTNGSTRQQNAKLERIGLSGFVDVVCTSESLGVSKPAAQAYHRTCAALGADPGETLMIGDNLDLDVVAARAAGLNAVHLDRAAGHDLGALLRHQMPH